MSTVPFRRRVAVWSPRTVLMLAVICHVGGPSYAGVLPRANGPHRSATDPTTSVATAHRMRGTRMPGRFMVASFASRTAHLSTLGKGQSGPHGTSQLLV